MTELFNTVVVTLTPFWFLALMIGKLLGYGLVIFGLYGIVTSSSNNGVSAGISVATQARSIGIGTILIIADYVLNVVSQTAFRQDSRQLLDYTITTGTGLGEQAEAMIGIFYVVLAVVGLYGFLKGWMLLRGKRPEDTGGKAAAYILGGVVAINFDVAMRMAASTAATFNTELAANIRLFIPG